MTSVEREAYVVLLERFHAWCEQRGTTFYVEMRKAIYAHMGEEPKDPPDGLHRTLAPRKKPS